VARFLPDFDPGKSQCLCGFGAWVKLTVYETVASFDRAHIPFLYREGRQSTSSGHTTKWRGIEGRPSMSLRPEICVTSRWPTMQALVFVRSARQHSMKKTKQLNSQSSS
jgi:hypothetical protein